MLILQTIISIILIILVMLQSKDSGLNNSFGATKTGYQTKTDPEKIIYLLTIFMVISFIVLSILNIAYA